MQRPTGVYSFRMNGDHCTAYTLYVRRVESVSGWCVMVWLVVAQHLKTRFVAFAFNLSSVCVLESKIAQIVKVHLWLSG